MDKFLTIACLFIAASLCGARAESLERVYNQRYAAPAKEVYLEVSRGILEVANGPADGQVEFAVTLQVQTKDRRPAAKEAVPAEHEARMERVFARLAPRFRADADRVRMDVADTQGVVLDWDPALQLAITVRVVVPAGLNLRVRNVGAGLKIEDDYAGNIDLRTETGSVYVKKIDGDLVARTGTGSITVAEVTGRSELRSDSGLVLAGRLVGPANLKTSVGSVEVHQAEDALKVRGDHADIILGLSSPAPKTVDLATGAGAITLNIDQTLPVTVDAATWLVASVRMRNLEPSLIKKGEAGGSTFVADFNGGGPVLKVRTDGGSVLLVGRAPMDG